MKILLSSVMNAWHIDLYAIRRDIIIAGSPERCEKRFVIEDSHHRLFLLEKIVPCNIRHRWHIARVIDCLKKNGLPDVISYIPDHRGDHVVHSNGSYWQLSPYVSGKPMDRPAYVFDRWRGRVMAAFLVALRQASQLVESSLTPKCFRPSRADEALQVHPPSQKTYLHDRGESFSIKKYIHILSNIIAHREPELRKKCSPQPEGI